MARPICSSILYNFFWWQASSSGDRFRAARTTTSFPLTPKQTVPYIINVKWIIHELGTESNLINCFHSIFNLMETPLWRPYSYISVILITKHFYHSLLFYRMEFSLQCLQLHTVNLANRYPVWKFEQKEKIVAFLCCSRNPVPVLIAVRASPIWNFLSARESFAPLIWREHSHTVLMDPERRNHGAMMMGNMKTRKMITACLLMHFNEIFVFLDLKMNSWWWRKLSLLKMEGS